ncbi:MAG: DUF1476 domain-containing protein [Phycisphaerales bacterium]|nr:DUF1476 domain-containing protein [Phycisphaerales bacterium]
MTGFSDREDALENKFAFDEEKRFRAEARRNKLLAQWVGERCKMTADEVTKYAAELIQADLKTPGDADVLRKVVADLKSRGITVTDAEVRTEMSRCYQAAAKQTASEG